MTNVFVRTDTMPGWPRPVVKAHPVAILSGATRGLLVDRPVTRPALWSLLWAAAIAAVFTPLAVARFKRRV